MASAPIEPQSKRHKTSQQKVIGTHNGAFHCDEALAVFLLRLTSTYRDSEVLRTRDPATLDTCDIVVDVGAVYDPEKQRYDHHQRGFTEVFGHGFVTKLSSAGLVFKHFGKEIISNHLQTSHDDPKIQTLWLKMYQEFIEAIDAVDNGISQYPTNIPPLYRSTTSLSSRVAGLNPPWNAPLDSTGIDAQFSKASALTGSEFLDKLNFYANVWLPARELLLQAIESSKRDLDPTGRIVLLQQSFPWKEHLFDIESAAQLTAEPSSGPPPPPPAQVLYMIYPDTTSAPTWRVQAVPVTPDSFESRKPLPEAWRGLRDAALAAESTVEDAVFVHTSGFIGGAKSRDGAIKLATLSLET